MFEKVYYCFVLIYLFLIIVIFFCVRVPGCGDVLRAAGPAVQQGEEGRQGREKSGTG